MTQEEIKFLNYLLDNKLRKTPERLEILRCILEFKCHFDVEKLYEALEKKGYHVSRATLYNTLDLLRNAGIVRQLLFDTHQAVYEVAAKNHTHLVCIQCGKVIEVELQEIEDILSNTNLNNFKKAYIATSIYGICDDCGETSIYHGLRKS